MSRCTRHLCLVHLDMCTRPAVTFSEAKHHSQYQITLLGDCCIEKSRTCKLNWETDVLNITPQSNMMSATYHTSLYSNRFIHSFIHSFIASVITIHKTVAVWSNRDVTSKVLEYDVFKYKYNYSKQTLKYLSISNSKSQ